MGRGPWIPPSRGNGVVETRPRPADINSSPFDHRVQKLSIEERETLQRDVQEKKAIVDKKDEGEIVAIDSQDPEAVNKMKRDLRRKEYLLAKDEELVAKGSEKDRVYKRLRELQDKIRPYMPSQKEMWRQMGSQDSELAIRKNIYFQKQFVNELMEIKSLQRRLEPDDPRSGNLEFIRPK